MENASIAEIDSALISLAPNISDLKQFVSKDKKLSKLATLNVCVLWDVLRQNPDVSTLKQIHATSNFTKFARALLSWAPTSALLKDAPKIQVTVPEAPSLVKCAESGTRESFHALLGKVPEDWLKTFEDEKGQSLLHHAARGGNLEVIKYILGSGIPVDIQSRKPNVLRTTPLMEAVKTKVAASVCLLITYDAQIAKIKSAENKTALDYADLEMKELIRQHKLDLRAGKISIPTLAAPPARTLATAPMSTQFLEAVEAAAAAKPRPTATVSGVLPPFPQSPHMHAPLKMPPTKTTQPSAKRIAALSNLERALNKIQGPTMHGAQPPRLVSALRTAPPHETHTPDTDLYHIVPIYPESAHLPPGLEILGESRTPPPTSSNGLAMDAPPVALNSIPMDYLLTLARTLIPPPRKVDFEGAQDMFSQHPEWRPLDSVDVINELWNMLESEMEEKRQLEEQVRQAREAERNAQNENHKVHLPECVICWDAEAAMVSIPCGHIGCCQKCAEAHMTQQCPVCRAKVAKLTRVYLA